MNTINFNHNYITLTSLEQDKTYHFKVKISKYVYTLIITKMFTHTYIHLCKYDKKECNNDYFNLNNEIGFCALSNKNIKITNTILKNINLIQRSINNLNKLHIKL